MVRITYRLGLAALGLYLYALGNGLWVLCAIALAWSFLQQQIAAILGVVRQLVSVPHEHDANSVLVYTFRIDKVVEHPAVDELFAKLLTNAKAPAQTVAEWRALLLESYARKYKRADEICEVTFNIKNNLLFVNREVDFGDHVYHEVEIPYRWTAAGDPAEAPILTPDIESQLDMRVLLVNGMLQLQVGRFSKEYSPNILHGGSLAVYETFATVTSFPLMYFSHQHNIPVRYLNLVAQATESYKASHRDRGKAKGKERDRYSDWRTLNQDIAAYRVLCDADNPSYSYKEIEKLEKAFQVKRDQLLLTGGYKGEKHHEDDWRYPDVGHRYWNEYGSVFFRNMNANRDSSRAEHWFTDYYEEEP